MAQNESKIGDFPQYDSLYDSYKKTSYYLTHSAGASPGASRLEEHERVRLGLRVLMRCLLRQL